METINNTVAQLRDLFRSMTPAARVTAGLLLAAVFVSMGYLFVGGGYDAEHLLFGGEQLVPGEIRAIEAALSGASIPFDTSGSRVRVPAHRQYEAMGAIAAAGAMPPNLHEIMTKALDSGSFWEGKEQAKLRLEIAQEKYLGMVIRTMMPWVEDAAVNFEEKRRRGLGQDDLVTAAVAITPVAGQSLDPMETKTLQELTAAWFGRGLTPEKVQVKDLRGGNAASINDSIALAQLTDNPYLRDLFLVEKHLRDKISNTLNHIRGVRVEVQAELTPELSSQTHMKDYKEKGTPTTIETEQETVQKTTIGPGGRVGVAAQGPGTAPSESHPTTESRTELVRDRYGNLVGSTDRLIQQVGLTPKDMKASIQIPMDWLIETVWSNQWRRRPNNANASEVPPPTEDDLQRLIDEQTTQIQSLIENLFPEVDAGEDAYPRVQVSFYEASDPLPTPEPTLRETAVAWTSAHWATLFMFILAVVSLVMLRSMVKSAGKPQAAATHSTFKLDLADASSDPDEQGQEQTERPKLKLNKGPTLKDDLAQLVREDPDTAATILRSWISYAA